jgi:glycosyl transferase family 25
MARGKRVAAAEGTVGGTGVRNWSAFVINLKRAPERWQHVSVQLAAAGIPFERIEAIDGKTLTLPIAEFSELSYRLLHGRYVNVYEIGCYLSHLAAMDRFLASGDEYGLILEDDVTISPDLPVIIDAAITWSDDWDVLRLSTVNRGRRFAVADLGEGMTLGVCFTREKGAGGYVLNRKAAAVFRRRMVPMRLAYDIVFDLEFFWGLHALGVEPLPILQKTGFDTQIQTDVSKLPGWRYFTVFPYRAGLETSRVFCRVFLYLRLKLKHGRLSAPAKPA